MKKVLLSFAAITSLSMVGMLFFNQGNLYSNASGAPGPTTCAQGGCHGDGEAAQTSSDVALTVTDSAGVAVTQYIAGKTYNVIFGKHATTSKVGFALSSSSGVLSANVGDTKVQPKNVGGAYLTHTFDGTAVTGGHAEWTATWTAPSSATAKLTLFINQTNSSGDNFGDHIFTKELQLTKMTTGLNTLSGDVSFKIFPNPTVNNLNISFDVKYVSPLKITMVSLDGKQVVELFNRTEAKGKFEKQFDISNFAKGIYLLNISTTEGNAHQKVMVN